MTKVPREVLLVGSVPLPSASAVFEAVAKHLGGLVSRIPDGEQIGWSSAVVRAVEKNDAFEVSRRVPLNAGGRDPMSIFKPKDGHSLRSSNSVRTVTQSMPASHISRSSDCVNKA